MRHPTLSDIPMIAAILAACVVLGGCSAQDAGATAFEAPGPNCSTDRDCPGGQTCRSGLCSSRHSVVTTLNFRFLPSTSEDFLPQHRADVRVRAEDSLDFLLQRGVTVGSGAASNNEQQAGGIRYANATTPGGPDGTLIFRPRDVSDSVFTRQTHVDNGRFDTMVNPGVYSVTFVPDNREKLPKKTWSNHEFTSNTLLSRTVLPPEDYLVVQGTLSRNVVLPDGNSGISEPVSNARIYALSADGKHSSTEVIPSARGEFELRVEPATGLYDVYVVPATSETMLPSVRFDSAFEALETECVTSDGGEGEICTWSTDLGAFPAEPVPVDVQLTAPADFDADVSWEGTIVVLSGPLGRGTFSHKFSVADDGSVTLEAFPADWSADELRQYTLEVIPPARSPFARSTFELSGTIESGEAHAFEVEPKRRLDGDVVDATGAPMASTELEFRLDAGAGEESAPRDERVVAVTTDDDGSFEVWLESAPYDVQIKPAQHTGQPRMLEQLDVAALDADEPLAFELPSPTVLLGSVFGARSTNGEEIEGVGDVTVEAYRVMDGRTVVLGQSRTDANGEFRMVVSSELGE